MQFAAYLGERLAIKLSDSLGALQQHGGEEKLRLLD